MYSSLIYNINVASSITAQGRALVSSAICQFEMFLANSIKFGSLNEVIQFIDNICTESRIYKDKMILDKDIPIQDCFGKLILSCGFRWVPEEDDMEIIWKMLNNLSQEDINRIYYKNNLYEFMSNSSMVERIQKIISTLNVPYLNPLKCPKEIKEDMDELCMILKEYVYYGYMVMDRIDKASYSIKSVTLISDTDSAIISLDAWYRFCLQYVNGKDYNILKVKVDPITFLEADEFGDITDDRWKRAITFEEPDYDFDFFQDKVIEKEHRINPISIIPQDNLRYTIINIMAYVLDYLVNDYMETFSKQSHSYRGPGQCKLILKNEFLFRRVLLTDVKKSYADIQEIQEGNFITQDMKTSLDVKGIACMAKSSMALSTRNALKKILYEDILNTPVVDQLKIVKDIAILEKQIMQSLMDGSKEYYKPLVVKSMSRYEDPMRQQGIKAIIVWNTLKDPEMPLLNLEERNSIDVAKVDISMKSIEKIKDSYPELYSRCKTLMGNKYFATGADCIAIPVGEEIPKWLPEFIDYKTIVNDNIGGFPLESVGSMRLENNNINYTNILKL